MDERAEQFKNPVLHVDLLTGEIKIDRLDDVILHGGVRYDSSGAGEESNRRCKHVRPRRSGYLDPALGI